ncbi:hypothetical protein MSP8887_03371 [Marinomonas spartinae]|uniref:Uncharacterized protein n=1 Tax=Marinomonas spartinae TaxID=1792290 RepID=A0A1A8TCK1_9GAMM|nr:hypothetical protein [Marinomonas spartinae]SBS29389.1 hypothetical protein MSP8886_01532 [Marinomonas spartinae]SBS38574.1 hypothetical protein MSP8887_03371 [Marinomonas spartinae]
MATSTNNKEKDKTAPALEEPTKKKSGKLIIGFLLCFLVSVGTSAGITFFLAPKEAKQSSVTEDKDVAKELATFQQTIDSQNEKLQAMKAENDILKLYLRHSSATALKNILINQEDNIQAFLKVLKASMADLTKQLQDNTPEIKNWNEQYQYQLDLALKGSLEREDLLKLLKTGEPNEKSQ